MTGAMYVCHCLSALIEICVQHRGRLAGGQEIPGRLSCHSFHPLHIEKESQQNQKFCAPYQQSPSPLSGARSAASEVMVPSSLNVAPIKSD